MTVNYRHCISLCINELFTDAEVREDGLEDFGWGDGSGYGAQVVDGLPEFFGHKVGGELRAKAVNNRIDGSVRLFECLRVPDVGYYQTFAVGTGFHGAIDFGGYGCEQAVDAFVVQCRYVHDCICRR